ncbi:MAG: hypothetical protein KAT27_06555 [Desulfobacterales bacterium]|nr:hypothetical protein [Desulfobacterales bacterium]
MMVVGNLANNWHQFSGSVMARKWRMEEFQMLDFSSINLSEWHDEIQIRAPDQIQTEMEESIEDHNEEFE